MWSRLSFSAPEFVQTLPQALTCIGLIAYTVSTVPYEWLTAVEHVQTAFSDRLSSGALGLAQNQILRRGRMTTMKKLTKAMTRKHKVAILSLSMASENQALVRPHLRVNLTGKSNIKYHMHHSLSLSREAVRRPRNRN